MFLYSLKKAHLIKKNTHLAMGIFFVSKET